ncbi:hypothetical protein PBRA_001738 [Plasmodiophora brassicae]|uniref:Uncharacterized protein n=1 Tax=Plasmodiophora brassicae TaxID=37360 RepID=A0A0G4IZB8_PLABS|nr:hypothetical protein PBRA_001738 [Plasmodiophora brassicae]
MELDINPAPTTPIGLVSPTAGQPASAMSPTPSETTATVATTAPAPSKAPQMVKAVRRLDLMERKRRLDDVLGERASDYWVAVEQYLTAKISRDELLEIVLDTVGLDNMALHNDFFLTILYNAASTEVPPPRRVKPPPAPPKASPFGDDVMDKGQLSDRVLAAKSSPTAPPGSASPLVMSPGGSLQAKAMSRPAKKKKPAEPVFSPFLQRLTMPPFLQPSTPSSTSAAEVPHQVMRHVGAPGLDKDFLHRRRGPADPCDANDHAEVRLAVQRRAREAGLKHVSDEAVAAVMTGLEQHLRQIVLRVVEQVRYGERPVLSDEQSSSSVGLLDLLAALTNYPSLIGDDLPLIRERIMLML